LIQKMDDAVAEVFERMLNRSCVSTQEFPAGDVLILARITFSGAVEAQCVLGFPSPSAQILTCAFLGPGEVDWDDFMVADTVGELCNMIAGGWKKRLGPSAWGADLSVPYTSLGSSLDEPDFGIIRLRRAYVFDDSPFVMSLKLLQATGRL
jgi:chemotaxis protein CheX